MRRLNSRPKDKRTHSCPQCGKQRMTRDLDHEVTDQKQEYKTKDGSTIELFIDICEFCKARNYQRYFEPTKADIRRVLKAMQEDAELGEEESLEELL